MIHDTSGIAVRTANVVGPVELDGKLQSLVSTGQGDGACPQRTSRGPRMLVCCGYEVNNSEGNNRAAPKNDKSAGKDDKSAGEGTSSRWRLAEHVFAVIGAVASLIAMVGVIIVGIEHTSILKRIAKREW
jgi:hypothetical protein